ncbi:NAD-binding protein, partial [Acinetobacter baumannii]|uniref:NAD-binding protein n=1 Tax=Acinetobacter baumannii TaxID=470 RepID=UPI001CB7B029
PGTFISLQRAPVERITVFDSSFAPFSSSTSTKPFAVWSAPVIGGGNSGVEAAIDLAGIVEHVTLVEFDTKLRADQVLQNKL